MKEAFEMVVLINALGAVMILIVFMLYCIAKWWKEDKKILNHDKSIHSTDRSPTYRGI